MHQYECIFSVINNFASSVSFAITGNNRRDEKFPIDAMEALICVIGKIITGLPDIDKCRNYILMCAKYD